MKPINIIFILICILGTVACLKDTKTADALKSGSTSRSNIVSNDLIPVTGTKLSFTGIAPIPNNFPLNVRKSFDRYTQVVPSNGKPINIYA